MAKVAPVSASAVCAHEFTPNLNHCSRQILELCDGMHACRAGASMAVCLHRMLDLLQPAYAQPCRRRSKPAASVALKGRAHHLHSGTNQRPWLSILKKAGVARHRHITQAIQCHATDRINLNALGGVVERICVAKGAGKPLGAKFKTQEEKLLQVWQAL